MIFWITAAAVCIILLAYSFFVERNTLSLTKIDLHFDDLPREFDGFTILQISDLHISHWWELERRLELLVKDIAPKADILVFTGDIAVNSRGARLTEEFIRRVRPSGETLAVYGNTEHKGRYGERRRADISKTSIRVLTNEHIVLAKGESHIVIAGVDDPFTGFDDLSKALKDAPKDAFTILLAHAPSIADEAAKAGVNLLISGHTHGGQVRFPLAGTVYSHLRKHRRLTHGLFEGERLSKIIGMDAGDLKVYVSRGVGISTLPFRFLCPPEIVLFTLKSLQ